MYVCGVGRRGTTRLAMLQRRLFVICNQGIEGFRWKLYSMLGLDGRGGRVKENEHGDSICVYVCVCKYLTREMEFPTSRLVHYWILLLLITLLLLLIFRLSTHADDRYTVVII